MLIVETIAKIRRLHFNQGLGIKTICRELSLSKKVVRKVLRSGATAFTYKRTVQPQPKLGVWTGELDRLLEAYPRETQEMVFDAHDRAFAFFRGTCTRGIYGNMKTAVDTIFAGKDRAYNRRFMQMCGHYLVDPDACTPASAWEKGQSPPRT